MANKTGKGGVKFGSGQINPNAGGRPAIPLDVKEAARAHTKDAIATLAQVMKDAQAPASSRVSAANSLIDRAWGRAEATVNVVKKNDVREYSRTELLAIIAASGEGASGEGGSEVQSGQVH